MPDKSQQSFAQRRITKREHESDVVRSGTEAKQQTSKVTKPKGDKPMVKRMSRAVKKV